MSLLTSDKITVALALSQYLLPDAVLTPHKTWGGDYASEYLSYLNLKPLFPFRARLSAGLQAVMDSAVPNLPDLARSRASPRLTLNEPIGVNGVLDEETDAELDRRIALWDDVAEFLSALSRARLEERIKAEKVMLSWWSSLTGGCSDGSVILCRA
ncbi:hypothetical protein BDN72DRAFT_907198 [Pluteus cervinus]|uniref:Uncharacterized protein n=1 Tax=Pluteus cervinus TaxID=181527 RepID=A0ACD2ZX92_9AGAR|nr:hypothetical protein BDN72DRAFT_907198 [Pluteus cervinus]